MKKLIKKKKGTKTKNKCIRRRKKKNYEIRINNVNNEHLCLVNYFKKLKKNPKKKYVRNKELEESEESDFEESDFEESEEYKKFYEELNKKYDFDKDGKHKDTKTKYDSNGFDKDDKHKDTKTKYDSNGFDKDDKHKDTGIFLNKKNINWLKNKDEFLK